MDVKINSCVATTTILMGVVGVYLNYHIDSVNYVEVFVMDYDMRELSRHEVVREPCKDYIKDMIDEAFGGLGGDSKEINFEDVFLNLIYSESDRSKSESYKKALSKSPLLSLYRVKRKMKKPPFKLLFPSHELSEYEIIHYFMMRLFAKHEVANYLSKEEYPNLDSAFTVIQNILNVLFVENEKKRKVLYDYHCLVFEDEYFLISGKIKISDSLVSFFSVEEITRLSPFQVAQTLKHDEIISLYSIENPNFEDILALENRRLSTHLYNNGRLYISYKNDNYHVNSKIFTLSDDISAKLFITDSNQLILSTKKQKDEAFWNKKLSDRFGKSLIKQGEWIFNEEILLDFIESGIDDFNKWLGSL